MDDPEIRKDDDKYLKGGENWIIRAYFYCSTGLGILNEFRNLFLGILAVYIALKLDNLFLAIGMFAISVVLLTLMGYYTVHKIAKVREWLGMRFSTHFGAKAFNYQAKSYELLQEIRDLLKNANH